MSVDAKDLSTLRDAMTRLPDNDDLAPLTSIPEVLGYVVAQSRAEGHDEADAVELVCKAAELSRDDVRAAQSILRRLGYIAVADRLKQLAKRSKPSRRLT